MSDAFAGPLFDRSAWTAAIDFWSDDAWSILLIIPMVLVPTTWFYKFTALYSIYEKIKLK